MAQRFSLSALQIVLIFSYGQILRGFAEIDQFNLNKQAQQQTLLYENNNYEFNMQYSFFGSLIKEFKNQSYLIDQNWSLSQFSSEKKLQNQTVQSYQKRNLASVKLIHGINMRSIVRSKYSNSQYSTKITDVQNLNSFMILGYFKSTQVISQKLSLIQVGVQQDYYNFLNLQFLNSTYIQLKIIQDSNKLQTQSQLINNLQNQWNCFGVAFSKQTSTAIYFYSDTNSKLISSSNISSVTLSPLITILDVCITCKIDGGVYSQYIDEVSSVKIIYDVTISQINNYYFYNEINIIQSQILSNSFNFDDYIPNSEYLMSQSYLCDSGYSFFEGVCINQNNCENIQFESDKNSQFETGKFFNSTAQKCMNCGSNCLKCTSQSACTLCRSSYIIDSGICIKCNDQNQCSSSCSGSQSFDPLNQMCVDSFNIEKLSLQNLLLSSRIMSQNNDMVVTPSLSTSNQIIHCYMDVDNNRITLYSFVGGYQFTTITSLTKSWTQIPNGYQKSVSFTALFYGNGNPSDLQVKINSNLATLDNNYQIVAQNKISCSGSGALTQSIFKVKFLIQDYQNFFNLEIKSISSNWAIRNLDIEILKCHYTCNSCYLGGSNSDCSSCNSQLTVNRFQCMCPTNYYAKYQNCFDSQCVSCEPCSVSNCLKCQDITGYCTQCSPGYIILNGQCIDINQCISPNKQYQNYCGIFYEQIFTHFQQDRIVDYGDFWKFYNSDDSAITCLTNRKCSQRIIQNRQHSLSLELPNYQSYHFQLELKVEIAFYYQKSEQLQTYTAKVFKNTKQFTMKFSSVCTYDDCLLTYSFSQMIFSYYRCHPMCKTCTDLDLSNCINCIDNAVKVNGVCTCQDGFYFTLKNNQPEITPPGSCKQCNSSCKTCNGPSYQECILCQDGYTKIGDICKYNCLQKEQYWDQLFSTCVDCHPCCKTCSDGSYTSCRDCKQGYIYKVQDNSCQIYNGQCQSCTIAVNYQCGGSLVNHQNCRNNGWVVKDANTCVSCNQYVNGKCGGNQTQEIIDLCAFSGYLNIDSLQCSSCQFIVSFKCGRNEIEERCYNNGWVVQDVNTCINCSKAVNGVCSLEQTQDSINACTLYGYFNYDNNNCSSCHNPISNNCGRLEIKDRCTQNGWELYNQTICVMCSKNIFGSCGVDKLEQQIQACFIRGFNNYDNQNCSSCNQVISNKCGRQEISSRCFTQFWDQSDLNKCLNCSENSPTKDQCFCDQSCSTCIRYFNPNSCKTCNNPLYFFENKCLEKCPNGYIIDQLNKNCVACTDKQMQNCFYCYKTCFICDNQLQIDNPNSCKVCSETRELVNGECQCIDQEDQRQIFYQCSYKTIAVLDAILSNIDSVLIINFGKLLSVQGNFQQDQLSVNFCQYLFTQETIQLLGTRSQCSFQNMYIYVKLDIDSNIFHKDLIYFKKNVLSFTNSPSDLIQTYYNNMVTQDKIIGLSQLIIDYNPIENSCLDFNFKYNKIINGAKRGVYKFSWSFVSFAPSDSILQTVVENLLKKANLEKNINLNIPKGIVKPTVSLIIRLDYTLKSNVEDFIEFPLTVKIAKQIILEIKSSIQNPFYRYKSGVVIITSVVKMCLPYGEEISNEPQNVQINSIEYPEFNYINTSFQQQYFEIQLKPYTLKPGTVVINVNSKLVSDQFISAQTKLEIYIQQTQLFIKIIGNSGQINYKIRDYDIESESEPQEIQIKWECIFPNDSTACINKYGDEIIFPPGQKTITIEGFTFQPYTVVKIALTGEKQPNRVNTDSKILFFSETDLPPLYVQIQNDDLTEDTVNINEEIYVELTYFTQVNIDLLSFSGTIQYDNNVVGLIKFDYTHLRFQIWNYFTDFNRNIKEIQFRFNVFNPQYYMPSLSTNTLKLNFPPNNCKLIVFPTIGGFSLETLYYIQFNECNDDDQPIQYQFFFYKTADEFEYEKKYPLQVKRRQLNDKSQKYFFQTPLPNGNILILGQAIDSKNAIYNSTISLDVQQKIYSEQDYLSIIQQKLDNLKKYTITDSITTLSILCDDILSRKEFKSSQLLNLSKIEIVNQLKSFKKQLSQMSTFSTAADKAIVSIFQSGVVYSQSELSDQFSQQIDSLDQSTGQSNHDNSQDNLKQKNYDQFQMIDAIGNSGLEINNTKSTDQILQLTNKIGQSLFKNILPNEEPISFKGQFINIDAKQMTEKYICEYFYCKQQINEIESQKQTNIYNFKKTEYQTNPFSQDSSFLNYTNQLKNKNPNLTIQSYSVIVPSISNFQNEQFNTFPKKTNLNFNIKPEKAKQKMACLSKDESNEWTKSGCSSVYDDIQNTYSCICSRLSPTTIINDIESLLDDSNASTVFSSDGISNIANFQRFYEYSIFWVLITLTFLVICLSIIGALLDNIDIKQKNKHIKFKEQITEQELQQKNQQMGNKIVPMNLDPNQDKNIKEREMELEDKQPVNRKLECSPHQIFSQSALLKENSEFVNDLNSQNISKLTLTPNSPSSDSVNLNIQLKLSQFSNKMQKGIKVVKTSKNNTILSNLDTNNNKINNHKNMNQNTIDENTHINTDQESNILIYNLQEQTTSSNQNNNTTQTNKYSSFNKLSFLKQILIFHNFFGVFFIYNLNSSRQVRFFIFYVRAIHSVSISLFFNQSYSIVQQTTISIINSVLIVFIIKILEKLIHLKGRVGKILGKSFILLIIFGYFYIILSITGGQTVSESNEFMLTFGMLFGGDIFIFSTIIAFISKMIAGFLIRNKKVVGFKKTLYKFFELQLVLLSIEMD